MTCWEKAVEVVSQRRVRHFQSAVEIMVAVQYNFKKAGICRLETELLQSSQFECRT